MKEQIEIFKALSDENRLKILEMLTCGELCACDIQVGLGLMQSTISHHMRVLQHAGIVKVHKRGKWVFYSINNDTAESLCNFLKKVTSPSMDCPYKVASCD